MDAKARAEQHFAAAEPDLRALRGWMYEHPEVAFEEQETSRHLAEFLAVRGFAVERPACRLVRIAAADWLAAVVASRPDVASEIRRARAS